MSTILLVLFYLLPMGLINLNTTMSYISHKRKNEEFNYPKTILVTLGSFIPFVNFILAYIVSLILSSEVYLIKYVLGLNDAMECSNCGIITRRHYLKDFEPVEDLLGDYRFDFLHNCTHCEESLTVIESENYRNSELPFGKRINPISGIKKFFTLGQSVNRREFTRLISKQCDLEFVDSQMESWQNLQSEKLKRMESKIEEIKLEQKENN